MTETLHVGDISISLTRKNVKHAHLSVHPPNGHVTLVAPIATRAEVARAFAISKLSWIRDQQAKMRGQARETPREFIERESHYVWGRRYLMTVAEVNAKPTVRLDHRRLTLTIRPGSSKAKREEIMDSWYRSLLHSVVPKLIDRWEPKLGVKVDRYYVQRMKTKWGGCNPQKRTIRLNTELAKKPKDLLEYVVVHEMLHLVVPNHSAEFQELLGTHFPTWRDARQELNELPLGPEAWT